MNVVPLGGPDPTALDRPKGARSSDGCRIEVPFEQIASLCEDFSRRWQPTQRLDIPSYLDRVPQDSRATLLKNLLQFEVLRRQQSGDRPQAAEYHREFPQFASIVRQVFLDSVAESLGGHGIQTIAETGDFQPLPASRLGDYHLIRELGRGGMGVVFEAVHVLRGNRVALKMLPQVDGSRLYRFKREFRSAADLSHPNLIALHNLEADGAQWFFTMDLVDGIDFLTHVRPAGTLDETRLRSALSQLVMGVMALHRNHIIHRDLKPSNVMVAHDGQVILLDFGLVIELDQPDLARSVDRIEGTPAYMAPEQAAGQAVTAASDWYAVGTMIYQALSGDWPFQGSMLAMLQAKQTLDPPPLSPGAGIPDDLAALSMRLLARNPLERPDTFEIAKQLCSSSRQETSAPGAGGSSLVGRDSQMARLKHVYRTLRQQGDPQTVFISGRSGEGKTTLGEHFLASLKEDQGLVVMVGRCYDRESVPFKALDALIDTLAGYLRTLPKTDAAHLMPDDIGILARVFPVLQRAEVVADAATRWPANIDEQQVRQRAFRALRSLLGRISRRSSVVWFIDDLQWGDADSAEVLFEVLRPPEAPSLMFIGTYRSEEAEESSFLTAWKDLQRKHDTRLADIEIKLTPLSTEECTELLIQLLGQDNEAIRRRAIEFARESSGNPFLLIELVGCFDPQTDSFRPIPIQEVLAHKLERLPAEAGPLLKAIAVSGQAIVLAECSSAAGLENPPISTINRMRTERLVRLIGRDDQPLIDTYHDKIRETVLGHLDDDSRKALHLALAETIERTAGGVTPEQVAAIEVEWSPDRSRPAPTRVFDLVYHFDAAGESRKACVYALLAAEQARRQLSLEVAARQFAIAKQNTHAAMNAVRYRIAEEYGETLMLLGSYEDASRALEGAIDLVDDSDGKARIEVLLGEIAFKQGLIEQSIALHESGLRRLGCRVPRSRSGFLLGALWQALIQSGHSIFPKRLHSQLPNSRHELVSRLLARVGHPYWFQNTLKASWAMLSAMNRAEQVPPSPQLAFAYAEHSIVTSAIGWQSRASRYSTRSIELRHQFDDKCGQGQSLCYKGIGLFAAARYEEGVSTLAEAIQMLAKTGDLWESNLAHFHKGCCYYGLGDLAQAISEARTTFETSIRIGEDSRAHSAIYLWAKAVHGDLPFDELRTCFRPLPEDNLATDHLLMAEGYWHSFHGRTDLALRAFQRAYDLVKDNLAINFHTAEALPLLATALRLQADATQGENHAQSQQLRNRALKFARWATRLTRLFPAYYPYSLRELSLQLAARGQTKKALKYVEKSLALAESQMARFEYAQSLLVRGRLANQLGLPEATEQIRTARAAIESIEQPLKEIARRGAS
jgi:eukaryotic-like serine/threonine-protein kinase